MDTHIFLDRKTYKETWKAQIFYIFVSLYEGTVFSFLTLFLSEARKNLNWTPLMTSLSLFLPCAGAAMGVLITSHFVSTQKKNLKIMRGLCIFSFLLIICLSLLGINLPTGLDNEGMVVNNKSYILLFLTFIILPSFLMASHWSFLSFQSSNNADINFAEGSKHGHICLYETLAPIVASPLAGFLAESSYASYKGYLLLFLVTSPVLLILFALTFMFKPFPPEAFHDDGHEKTTYKELFANKTYLTYLVLAAIWIPIIWASDSLVSNYWTSLESSTNVLNMFNPVTWGLFVAFSSLVEFTFIFFNTKRGFGKKVRFSMTLAFIALFIECTAFSFISYFFLETNDEGVWLLILIIALHALKGAANGLYLTSNLAMLHHILGAKLRRKAVFFAPFIFQIVNSILQLVYPYLITTRRSVAFVVLAIFAIAGFVGSLFLDVSLLHEKKSDDYEE